MTGSTVTPLPLVVLVSGNGSNLQAMIDAIASGELPAEIRAVIANRGDAYGLERARQAGIPARVLKHRDFADRRQYDQALRELIDTYEPGMVVLAGFMRILTADFVNHYARRLLNIHPSLLPAYQGLQTHERALADGAREHGTTVHFVTEELDGGPAIIQAAVPIAADDTAESLAQKVHAKEHVIYPLAIRWIAEGRLTLDDDTPRLDGHALTKPYRLEG